MNTELREIKIFQDFRNFSRIKTIHTIHTIHTIFHNSMNFEKIRKMAQTDPQNHSRAGGLRFAKR